MSFPELPKMSPRTSNLSTVESSRLSRQSWKRRGKGASNKGLENVEDEFPFQLIFLMLFFAWLIQCQCAKDYRVMSNMRMLEPSITKQYSTTSCSDTWMTWSEKSNDSSLWSVKTRRREQCNRFCYFAFWREIMLSKMCTYFSTKGTGSGSEKSKTSGSGMTLADVEEMIAEKNQALQKQQQLMQKQEKERFRTVCVSQQYLKNLQWGWYV